MTIPIGTYPAKRKLSARNLHQGYPLVVSSSGDSNKISPDYNPEWLQMGSSIESPKQVWTTFLVDNFFGLCVQALRGNLPLPPNSVFFILHTAGSKQVPQYLNFTKLRKARPYLLDKITISLLKISICKLLFSGGANKWPDPKIVTATFPITQIGPGRVIYLQLNSGFFLYLFHNFTIQNNLTLTRRSLARYLVYDIYYWAFQGKWEGELLAQYKADFFSVQGFEPNPQDFVWCASFMDSHPDCPSHIRQGLLLNLEAKKRKLTLKEYLTIHQKKWMVKYNPLPP